MVCQKVRRAHEPVEQAERRVPRRLELLRRGGQRHVLARRRPPPIRPRSRRSPRGGTARPGAGRAGTPAAHRRCGRARSRPAACRSARSATRATAPPGPARHRRSRPRASPAPAPAPARPRRRAPPRAPGRRNRGRAPARRAPPHAPAARARPPPRGRAGRRPCGRARARRRTRSPRGPAPTAPTHVSAPRTPARGLRATRPAGPAGAVSTCWRIRTGFTGRAYGQHPGNEPRRESRRDHRRLGRHRPRDRARVRRPRRRRRADRPRPRTASRPPPPRCARRAAAPASRPPTSPTRTPSRPPRAQIEEELGQIDVWVNVAMTAVLAELWDCTPEEFLRVTQVTYLGSMHGIQAALRRFRPRDRGVIVQVGSALSRRGIPLQSSYCGAKHAVKGSLDSLRAELIARGLERQGQPRPAARASTRRSSTGSARACTSTRSRCRRSTSPRSPRARSCGRPSTRGASCGSGFPTVYTILGERVASGLMDRYLGRTNIKAQEAAQPIDPPTRKDNLFEPPPGDPGAHGMFDDQAHGRSPQLWLATHKRPLGRRRGRGRRARRDSARARRAQPQVAVGVELHAAAARPRRGGRGSSSRSSTPSTSSPRSSSAVTVSSRQVVEREHGRALPVAAVGEQRRRLVLEQRALAPAELGRVVPAVHELAS